METERTGRMPKHVQVLLANRMLIEDNVIFNQKLYEKMAQMRVLPDTMLRDVRNAPAEEKVDILLDHVGKMGPRAFRRLCDMLHAAGYSMVAEHLRYNSFTEQQDKGWFIEAQERFPHLRRMFTQVEMTTFYHFLQDKITEQIAKRMWLLQSRERAQLLAERSKITANEMRQHNIIREKLEEIHNLKESLRRKDDEMKEVQKRLSEMNSKFHDSEATHSEQHSVLVQSNKAYERSNDLMQSRLDTFNTQIKRMNIRIRQTCGEDSENVQNDISNIKVSKLEDNLERLFAHIGRVEKELKRLMQRRKSERKRLFASLGIEDNRQDLTTAYHQSTADLAEVLQNTHSILTKMLTHVYSQHSVSQMVYRRTGESLSSGEKVTSANRLLTLAQGCIDKVRLLEVHTEEPKKLKLPSKEPVLVT